MWAINVRFLRGVCVATDTGQWDASEWPPHPARVFMSMACAYFETSGPGSDAREDAARRDTLEWLERQPAPTIFAAPATTREPVTCFVPVNDATRADQLFASSRSRQPRHFPTSVPQADTVHYSFGGDLPSEIADVLDRVAEGVVRVGHSSSLVQVWIDRDFVEPGLDGDVPLLRHEPINAVDGEGLGGGLRQRMRTTARGLLEQLEALYNSAAVEEYAELEVAIAASSGRTKIALRKSRDEKFAAGAPLSQRPRIASTTAYRQTQAAGPEFGASYFDPALLVLALPQGRQLGLETTLQLTAAWADKIRSVQRESPVPEWLSGRRPDGTATTRPHVAVVPLPYVGTKSSDGHLLGVAIIFPREVSDRDRGEALRPLFERSPEGGAMLRLSLPGLHRLTGSPEDGEIVLRRDPRPVPPRTLDPPTWTDRCSVWETVTPVALDRFPKSDWHDDREAWNDEVSATIARGCEHVGLPPPSRVDVHYNAFLRGVPTARPGRGFPPLRRGQGPARFSIHARIWFDRLVTGPVLVGAGRFAGYGFCRPNHSFCRRRRS